MGGSISKIIENSNSIGIFLNSSIFNNVTENNISNSTSVGIKVSDTSKNNTSEETKLLTVVPGFSLYMPLTPRLPTTLWKQQLQLWSRR